MTGLRIWQVAFIEHHLRTQTGPALDEAIRTAYTYGFEIDDIHTITGLDMDRIRDTILHR